MNFIAKINLSVTAAMRKRRWTRIEEFGIVILAHFRFVPIASTEQMLYGRN
jgi:hypothetical protein